MPRLRVLDLAETELSTNWLRAGRLMRKRDEGDEEAKEELERMDDTEMVPIDEIKD